MAYCQYADQQNQQDQQENVLEVNGQISRLDWIASTITVKYKLNPKYDTFNEIVLNVTLDSEIVKDTAAIYFTQLRVGDQVAVKYVETSDGQFKVVTMRVVFP